MGVTAVGIPPPLAAVAPAVPPTASIGTVNVAVTTAAPTPTTQSETPQVKSGLTFYVLEPVCA